MELRTQLGAAHRGPAIPDEPDLDSPLPDRNLDGCSDSALVAAIRQCESLRYRVLHDQLALLGEARRRGLRLPPGPRPAPDPTAEGPG